jgi:hypothetical protein
MKRRATKMAREKARQNAMLTTRGVQRGSHLNAHGNENESWAAVALFPPFPSLPLFGFLHHFFLLQFFFS